MSPSSSKPPAMQPVVGGGQPARHTVGPPAPYSYLADSGLDAALRCVPLPDGFLKRLHGILTAAADEPTDT